jgi:hypothetical protein
MQFVSISVSSPSWRARVLRRLGDARAWVARALRGPELPSYERSREELGGVPWRRFEQSDAWFIKSSGALKATSGADIVVDPPPVPAPSAAPRSQDGLISSPSLASIDLRKPLVSRRTLVIGATLGSVALVVGLAVSHKSGSVAPVPVVAAPAAPVTTPPPAAPATPAVAHRAEHPRPAKAAVHVRKLASKRARHARRS